MVGAHYNPFLGILAAGDNASGAAGPVSGVCYTLCDGGRALVAGLSGHCPAEDHVLDTVRLRVSTLNIEGDEQSDLTVHGGTEKAVYAYPAEHYPAWRQELGTDLPRASFGENLTTEGLTEGVRIGDRFRIGSAEFVVTQPRMPCYKLGIRLGRPDVLRRMLRTGRTGFYLSVAAEGEMGAGDAVELVRRSEDDPTVADVVRLFTVEAGNQNLLRRAMQSPVPPQSWKDYFAERLE